jgi:hypothetical protein
MYLSWGVYLCYGPSLSYGISKSFLKGYKSLHARLASNFLGQRIFKKLPRVYS